MSVESLAERIAKIPDEERAKLRFCSAPKAIGSKCNLCKHRKAHKKIYLDMGCDVYLDRIPSEYLFKMPCKDFVEAEDQTTQ